MLRSLATATLDETTLQQLLHAGLHEDGLVEFKEHVTGMRAAQILRSLTAFANGEGGDFIVGISDERELLGIDLEQARHDTARIVDALNSGTDPVLRGVECRTVPLTSGTVLLIVRVGSSPDAPHMVTADGQNRFYHRLEASTLAMKAADVREAVIAWLRRRGTLVPDTVQQRIQRLPRDERDLLSKLAQSATDNYYAGSIDSADEPWCGRPDLPALHDAARGLHQRGLAKTQDASQRWVARLTPRGFLLAKLAADESGTRRALVLVQSALAKAPSGPVDKLRAHCLGKVSVAEIHAALECWAEKGLLQLQLVNPSLEHTRVFNLHRELLQAGDDDILPMLGLP